MARDGAWLVVLLAAAFAAAASGAPAEASAPPRWRWPVRGRITGRFGATSPPWSPEAPHSGVDIAAPAGEPVRAAAGGRVVIVGDDPAGFGRYVVQQVAGGYHLLYAHLREGWVYEGVSLADGEVLGSVGATGRATGPHLHFGVYGPGPLLHEEGGRVVFNRELAIEPRFEGEG